MSPRHTGRIIQNVRHKKIGQESHLFDERSFEGGSVEGHHFLRRFQAVAIVERLRRRIGEIIKFIKTKPQFYEPPLNFSEPLIPGREGRRDDGRNPSKTRRISCNPKKKQGRIHGTRCAQYAYFSPSKITRDRRTDGRTDGPTDGHDLLQRCDGASKNELEQL